MKNSDDLRKKAEEKLRRLSGKNRDVAPEDLPKIIHELEVHQIELEMQNEELRHTHVEIENSRAKYSDLYDFAPVGYFTFDKNGLILEVNLTGASLLGTQRLNLIHKPFKLLIEKEYQDEFYHHCRDVLASSEKKMCEVKLKNDRDEDLYVQLLSFAVKDAGGVYSQMRTAVSNITERKKTEEERNALFDELALKNTYMAEFIRSLGHETRTPLNSIMAVAGILQKKMDGELTYEQEKQVGMIHGAAHHMLAIVNDLLDLSRIEAGMTEVNLTEFTIDTLFHSAYSTMISLTKDKGLKLEFEIGEGLPKIRTDFKLAIQVLLNLLSNAVKFTDKGGIWVDAKSEISNLKSHIRISVKDTGIGIPEDKIDIIFTEFKQVHARDDIPKGTGLGLSISKKIVKILGGGISAKSNPGKGSTFSFTLPVEFKD